MSSSESAIVLPDDYLTATTGTTTPTAGYIGTDYADWYKHYSSKDYDGVSSMMAKPDWMSTHDYNRGVTLYGDYVARKNIGSNYDYAVGMANAAYDRTASAAEKTRRQEMEYAGVLYERMKKYLPHQQKMAGMGNMGVAQTGLNQVTNTHMNRRGAIQGEYNDTMADADYTRAMAIGAAEQTRATALSERDGLTAQQMADIYTAEEDDKETARTNDINAFKASISSYASKEEALTDLAALGLSETDPEYIALKTQIEGHFRDERTRSYDNAMEEIWNHPDSTTALAYIETLDTTGWTEQQIEQLKARAALLDYKSPEEIAQGQENALAAYNSQLAIKMQANSGDTDAMYDLLESFKDRLSPDAYETAKMELDAYANDPQRQYETKQNEMSQQEYIDGMLMLDAADKAGYSDVDEYKEAVLAGEQDFLSGGRRYYIADSEPLKENHRYLKTDLFEYWSSRAKEEGGGKIKNGTVIQVRNERVDPLLPRGLRKPLVWVVYYDGKWYEAVDSDLK